MAKSVVGRARRLFETFSQQSSGRLGGVARDAQFEPRKRETAVQPLEEVGEVGIRPCGNHLGQLQGPVVVYLYI